LATGGIREVADILMQAAEMFIQDEWTNRFYMEYDMQINFAE